jgi:hypothetical protein
MKQAPGAAVGERLAPPFLLMRAHDACLLFWQHLAQLDVDGAAGAASRRMGRAGWIAHVSACGVIAVLIGKHALDHEKFFSRIMPMHGKLAACGIFDEAGRAGDLPADPLQHPPLHSGLRRGQPGQS